MKTLMRNTNLYPETTVMNQIFEDLLTNSNWSWPQFEQRYLPIDVMEMENSLIVKAAVPGVEPNDIDVSLENNILTIKGETHNAHEKESTKVFHQEIRYGTFTKSVRLPEGLNLDRVVAEFNHGFVTITIPKVEQPKPKQIKIAIAKPTEGKVKGETESTNSVNKN